MPGLGACSEVVVPCRTMAGVAAADAAAVAGTLGSSRRPAEDATLGGGLPSSSDEPSSSWLPPRLSSISLLLLPYEPGRSAAVLVPFDACQGGKSIYFKAEKIKG